MTNHRKRIVILGGSYAGLAVAKELGQNLHQDEAEIILITDQDFHTDVPQLYEIATAYLYKESSLSTESIYPGSGVPVTQLLERWPVHVVVGRVHDIQTNDRLVLLADKRAISFDWLVVTIGAPAAVYAIPGVKEYAFTLKTLNDALRVRHHIMRCVLQARTLPLETQKEMLRFVIVGAGATGVELATELSGLMKRVKAERNFKHFPVEIILLEAGPDILREVPDPVRHTTQNRLKAMGIEVRVNQAVSGLEEHSVILNTGEEIKTHTIVWSGGITAHEVLVRSKFPIRGRGMLVQDTLQVQGHPNIFAAGDCAVLDTEKPGVPAVVPVAYTQGAVVARNVLRAIRQQPLEKYQYQSQGQLIMLGGKKALVVWPSGRSMIGVIPWIIRQIVMMRYWIRYMSWWQMIRLTIQRLAVQTKND